MALFESTTHFDDSEVSGLDDWKHDLTDLEPYQSWECISLLRKNKTTFDLVIKDQHELMAFIHVVYRHLYQPKDSRFLAFYRILKFKMKVAYEAWMSRISIKDLFLRAIFKTLF